MRITKFLFLAVLTSSLIFILNVRWDVGMMLPPLGKFMNPFYGFWQNAELSQIGNIQTEIKENQLLASAQVVYDDLMIPHIFAENDQDLYYLQGYVTAQHRLWQMDFQTYVAAGRLTEIMGEKVKNTNILDIDRYQRRIGLKHSAQKLWKKLQEKPKQKVILEAYAKGVNDYIQSLAYRDLPIEYKLFNYEPESWTPLKTLLILKLMAQNLSFTNADLEYTNALVFGKNYFQSFYPEYFPEEKPIVEKDGNWDFEPIPIKTLQDSSFVLDAIYTDPLNSPNPDNGSNNWAVSGAKTSSGNPMLCSDPHLGLHLPAVWYATQLQTPDHNVYGVSLPGTPFVVIGFNDSIAWGMTNALRDVVDWYKIEFKDSTQNQYQLDGEWKTAQKVKETYHFYNRSSSFTEEIRHTNWGPVVYDNNFSKHKGQTNLALRWTAHDISDEIGSLYALNRAKNRTEFTTAIQNFACPAQNFAFASTDGDIMMRVQGKFPLKWKSQGKFVMDGSRSENAWQGYIPQNHAIESINPTTEYVFSANQRPADLSYPYYVFSHRYKYYRDRRLAELLDSLTDASFKNMAIIQNDNYNLQAAENLEFLMSKLDTASLNEKEQRIFEKLSQWNFYNDSKKLAPSYFKTWIAILHKKLIWDEWNEAPVKGQAMKLPRTINSLRLLRNKPDFAFLDITATKKKREMADDLIQMAFKMTADSIAQWKKNREHNLSEKWENYKETRLRHLIPALDAFSSDVMRNGGEKSSINAMSSSHGPSWRMIVELDKKGVKAWGIYPGGQSGNPGSPFYLNLATDWEQGKYRSLWFMSSKDDKTHQILLTQKFMK